MEETVTLVWRSGGPIEASEEWMEPHEYTWAGTGG
jgi:hypothetical protein